MFVSNLISTANLHERKSLIVHINESLRKHSNPKTWKVQLHDRAPVASLGLVNIDSWVSRHGWVNRRDIDNGPRCSDKSPLHCTYLIQNAKSANLEGIQVGGRTWNASYFEPRHRGEDEFAVSRIPHNCTHTHKFAFWFPMKPIKHQFQHVHFDSLPYLATWFAIRDAFKELGLPPVPVLINSRAKEFVKDILKTLGMPLLAIDSGANITPWMTTEKVDITKHLAHRTTACIKWLFIGSPRFTHANFKPLSDLHFEILDHLRKGATETSKSYAPWNPPPLGSEIGHALALPTKLFVTRRSFAPTSASTRWDSHRELVNDKELYTSVLQPLGFEAITITGLTLAQKASLFARAKVVLWEFGTTQVNTYLLPKGTLIIVLVFPNKFALGSHRPVKPWETLPLYNRLRATWATPPDSRIKEDLNDCRRTDGICSTGWRFYKQIGDEYGCITYPLLPTETGARLLRGNEVNGAWLVNLTTVDRSVRSIFHTFNI